MNEEIIIIAEHGGGKINPATYELVTFAEELRMHDPAPIIIVIIGNHIDDAAQGLAEGTGMHVIGIENNNAADYSAEAYITILADFLSSRNARYVCVPHTSSGFEYAPALAVKLQASCISGVESLKSDNGKISAARSVMNGKFEMDITPVCAKAVFTVMPGAFKAKDSTERDPAGSCETIKSDFHPRNTKQLGIMQAEKDDYPINDADVIIAAGRGLGKKENLNLIYRLAGIFRKAAIGASRPVCDLGWLDHGHQVGTTGKTVAPKLYIACGISGTIQHVSGMKGSKLVAAINTDPNAAIFNFADYCIVEDINTFIPALIEEYGRRVSTLGGD